MSDMAAIYWSSYTACGLVVCAFIIPFIWLVRQHRNRKSWRHYGVKEAKLPSIGFTDFRAACKELITEHGDTVGVPGSIMMLITRDVNLLKHVLIKDFNNFTDRAVGAVTVSYLDKGVFFLQGKNWRRMRHILSPSFSTGKLKHMCPTIDQAAQRLTAVFENLAKKGELLPVKYISGQYTSEIIARTGFGLETHCLGGEDDEFTSMAKTVVKIQKPVMNFVMMILLFIPSLHSFLAKTLGISLFDQVNLEADRYFKSVLSKTVALRQEMVQKKQKIPKDILQSLIQAKELGDQNGDQIDELARSESWDDLPKNMSEEELMGQSMLILFAGFETTSTTLQFCLYLLAQHQDVQEKLYQEIQEVVKSETPTYEELNKLNYMEQVLNETLRLYPPLPIITRKPLETKTYDGITIPKDTWVIVTLDQIMMDPKHYPNPEMFDPDRFSEENMRQRDSLSFVPFGAGPRLCLGMRLAYLELKMALTHVLRKVRVELNESTVPKPGEIPKITFRVIVVVDKPIQLALTLRNQ